MRIFEDPAGCWADLQISSCRVTHSWVSLCQENIQVRSRSGRDLPLFWQLRFVWLVPTELLNEDKIDD